MKDLRKRKYRTQSTAEALPRDSEAVSKSPSLTIPDQSLTVKQILQRSQRGGEVRTLLPQYLPEGDEEGLGVDVDKLDRMEKLELLQEVQQTVIRLRNKKWKTKEPEPKPEPKPEIKPEPESKD